MMKEDAHSHLFTLTLAHTCIHHKYTFFFLKDTSAWLLLMGNLKQTWVTLEKGISVVGLPSLRWLTALSVGNCVHWWLVQYGSAHYGRYHAQTGESELDKKASRTWAMESKLVNSIPLWSLLQFLNPSSCLEVLPWAPSLTSCLEILPWVPALS